MMQCKHSQAYHSHTLGLSPRPRDLRDDRYDKAKEHVPPPVYPLSLSPLFSGQTAVDSLRASVFDYYLTLQCILLILLLLLLAPQHMNDYFAVQHARYILRKMLSNNPVHELLGAFQGRVCVSPEEGNLIGKD